MAFYVADFAIEFVTGRLLYIYTRSRMTYSYISGKGGETKMFDNLKGKTNKKFDDMFGKTGVPDTIKINESSIFSDPKIAELMLTEHQ